MKTFSQNSFYFKAVHKTNKIMHNIVATVLSNSPEDHIPKNGTMRFELDYIENCWSNSPMSQGMLKFPLVWDIRELDQQFPV